MVDSGEILVCKRVALLNSNIKVSFKDLFKSLGKALIDFKSGNIPLLIKDIVDTVGAINIESDVADIAWLLIFRSLSEAIHNLVDEHKFIFISEYKNFDAIAEEIEELETTINRNFFYRPKDLSILKDIAEPFQKWLKLYGLDEAQAQSICNRLPSYFVFALNNEWRSRPKEYEKIKQNLVTPFSEAVNKEESWQVYSAWLQKQVDEPMFAEAFSLKQVYISPRAYYEEKKEINSHEDDNLRELQERQSQKVVFDLETHLETWLYQANNQDAIRVISGDPGAGKSSFAKMFAAKLSEVGDIPIIFIPLHHFDPTGDLVESVGKFVRDDDYLSTNPLEGQFKEPRLLIIFDGLDELSMQGKLGAQVARGFLREVENKVSHINLRQTRLQVIISGRPVVIQANQDEFRKPEQILHILPYFVPYDDRSKYKDDNNLLGKDQRNIWWQKYGEVSGNNYSSMPKELKLYSLVEITSQPLLNYLVALSYKRSQDLTIEDKTDFSEATNLNTIYQSLLKSVYARGWDTDQHPTLKGVKYEQFVRILEEIALAAWHGDGRTTTVREIEEHCHSSGLKKLLKKFAERAESGVTNLLTAFYFRQSGYSREGDKTFEFTHKSFGEYLTAKRIVRALNKINKELQDREKDPDEGWDEKQALTHWITICGMSAIDEYLFNFICQEISLQDKEIVKQWQQNLCHLIGYMLRQGMPMEKIVPRPSYQEECRQSRNAEEALLVVLNSCARYTEDISQIQWQSEYSFAKWLSRLQNQIEDESQIIVNQCLSWLNLKEVNLECASLKEANLEGANLEGANLLKANLLKANLQEASLAGVNLQEASLAGAILLKTNLIKANLRRANLQTACISGSNLEGANLEGANLLKANLEGANLLKANITIAIIDDEDPGFTYFEIANFAGANLYGVIMDEELRNQLKAYLDNG